MRIDMNELCGWINSCTNNVALLSMRNDIDARLRDLGYPVAPMGAPAQAPLSGRAARRAAAAAAQGNAATGQPFMSPQALPAGPAPLTDPVDYPRGAPAPLRDLRGDAKAADAHTGHGAQYPQGPSDAKPADVKPAKGHK